MNHELRAKLLSAGFQDYALGLSPGEFYLSPTGTEILTATEAAERLRATERNHNGKDGEAA